MRTRNVSECSVLSLCLVVIVVAGGDVCGCRLCTEAVPWAGLQAAEIQHAVMRLDRQLDLSSPRVASDPFHTVLQYGLSRNPDQRRLSLEQTRAMIAEHLMVTDNFEPVSHTSVVCGRGVHCACLVAVKYESSYSFTITGLLLLCPRALVT